jgi:ABC-2 type transport system ATP-binding protein
MTNERCHQEHSRVLQARATCRSTRVIRSARNKEIELNETAAIQTERLSKTFGRGAARVRAVDGLDLDVPPGQVYGFLGPNGAGKTTTIRMLLSLVRPTGGTARIFGQDVRAHPQVLRRVGALVEQAAFYGCLSARDNLAVLARTANDYCPRRIVELLALVGLDRHAGRQVKGFSTGMRQRLGIAAALLGDPELVILDEPTNGLDPAGIQEMRRLIRDLARVHGKTVFLSSHLLGEVEQVCDRVAILRAGRVVGEGAVSDLLSEGAQLRVLAAPLERARAILAPNWPATADGEEWLAVRAPAADAPRVVRRLSAHDVDVYQVTVQKRTLEDCFMAVTQAEEEGEDA